MKRPLLEDETRAMNKHEECVLFDHMQIRTIRLHFIPEYPLVSLSLTKPSLSMDMDDLIHRLQDAR